MLSSFGTTLSNIKNKLQNVYHQLINWKNEKDAYKTYNKPMRQSIRWVRRPWVSNVKNHIKRTKNTDIAHEFDYLHEKINPVWLIWQRLIKIVPLTIVALWIFKAMIHIDLTNYSRVHIFTWRDCIILLIVVVLWCVKKTRDHEAYYMAHAIQDKLYINRRGLQMIQSHDMSHFWALDKYRKHYAKYILFPSKRELHAAATLTKTLQTKKPKLKAGVEKASSIKKRREEHQFAKQIADFKQKSNGGPNEYEQWAKKYRRRTTKQIRFVIDETLGKKNNIK